MNTSSALGGTTFVLEVKVKVHHVKHVLLLEIPCLTNGMLLMSYLGSVKYYTTIVISVRVHYELLCYRLPRFKSYRSKILILYSFKYVESCDWKYFLLKQIR